MPKQRRPSSSSSKNASSKKGAVVRRRAGKAGVARRRGGGEVSPDSGEVEPQEAVATKPAAQEPSPEDLAREVDLAAETVSNEKARAKRRQPPAGQDLMATYMDELSYIPLFSPDQEIEHAKQLEEHEVRVWTLVLSTPKALVHLCAEGVDLEPTVRRPLERLLESYRRASTRSKGRHLAMPPARAKEIARLAKVLRPADNDNELMENVVQRVRREVWSRRVLDANPLFRITHARLSEIEAARQGAVDVRNRFVRANLRLVVSVARNFHHYRIPFIDLIQEGNVGLMKAVERFDHRRGFRFSTYAHWWIRQSIERAIINKGSQVRLPVHVIDSRRQVARAAARLAQNLERRPSVEEIAKQAELPVDKVEQVLAGVQQDPVSLDDSVSGDDPRKYLDLVRDPDMIPLDESVIRENTHARVKELLSMLNPIEKDIIRRRFGLGDDSDQTLDEIGKLYNLSRERVRQIQAQGLMKMRRMCERRQIS